MNKTELINDLTNNGLVLAEEDWEQADDEGYLDAIIRREPHAKNKMLSFLMEKRSPSPTPAGWTREARTTQENVQYECSDRLRILALSEYFAALANDWPDVRTFREEVLGGSPVSTEHMREYAKCHSLTEEESRALFAEDGMVPFSRLLTSEEAHAFITSRVCAVMSLDQFKEWGIPVIGHEVALGVPSSLYEQCTFEKHDGLMVTMTVTPPGDSFVMRAPYTKVTIDGYKLSAQKKGPAYPVHCILKDAAERTAAIIMSGNEQYLEKSLTEDVEPMKKAKEYVRDKAIFCPNERTADFEFARKLAYWNLKGSRSEISDIWPGSLLDGLHQMSRSLAKVYHWREEDSVMFVLTGNIPQVQALKMSTTTFCGHDFNDAFVDIKVLPWVALDTVKKLYQNAQRRLLHKSGKRSERTIEVFRFVIREAGVYPSDGQWKTLFDKWQAENPDEPVPFKFPRDIKQSYERARKNLLDHNYSQYQANAES